MNLTPDNVVKLLKTHKTLKQLARAMDWSREKVRKAYNEAIRQGKATPLPMGGVPKKHYKLPTAKQRAKAMRTKRARHHTYILTCAQNNTDIHQPTWESLKALAAHDGAEIFVSTFLYVKRGLGARNDKAKINAKDGSKRTDLDEITFAPEIMPYINNDRVEIAKGLVWCGELNILPTASRPLSGLEVYTGRKSMIVPHTHVAMQSIATIGGAAKLNYTTGTVTQRNYIQRKEGFKAEFHHIYGALIVEVDEAGHWWVRQIQADSDGTIYDLDRKVQNGKVTTGNRIEALTAGDVHVAQIDPGIEGATWGKGGLVDQLRPKYQFIHDVLDMYARSHHTKKDPYKVLIRHVRHKDSVETEVDEVRSFLMSIAQPDCKTIVVNSNHDRHLARWLAENDARFDPVNAAFWSKLNSLQVQHIVKHHSEPDLLALAVGKIKGVTFLPADTSFVICDGPHGGIECGMHYDQGPNGARGSLRTFAKMGRRSNGGHSHSAGIDGGAYQAGTKSKLKLEYNHGPSSWSHSDIVTYPNGKRSIVTFFNGKYRRA